MRWRKRLQVVLMAFTGAFVVLAALIAGTVGLGNIEWSRVFNPSVVGDFTLKSAEGSVSLRDHRGQAVVLYFGYTYCPSVCPMSLVEITNALKQLAPRELDSVRVFFVSVDPERDTVERLKTYAAAFHPRIIGLTGSPEELKAVAKKFGAFFAKAEVDSEAGYLVDHTSRTYVIDRAGKLSGSLPHGAKPNEIVEAIKKALK